MNIGSVATPVGALLAVAFGCACSSGGDGASSGGGAAMSGGSGGTCAIEGSSASSGGGSQDAATEVVPLGLQRTESDGTMRFSLPIVVGGATLETQFDTGSSGLRILEGALPASAYDCVSGTPVEYQYHSGLMISGVVATAKIRIGSFSTPSTIPVMLVREVGCTLEKPDCDAAGQTPETYTFFGPFKAVLGVGMRNDATSEGVVSPIAELAGHPAFAVKAPSYGGTNASLWLGPASDVASSYATFALPHYPGVPLPDGTPTWDDRYGLPACVNDKTSNVNYCVPAELDTGNPPVYIEWQHATTETLLPPGHAIEVEIGPAEKPLAKYGFTISGSPTPGIDEIVVEPALGPPFMNLGTGVFFREDVLFDPHRGIVGFAPH